MKLHFSHPVRETAWCYMQELLEGGWKEKEDFSLDKIPHIVGCNYIYTGNNEEEVSKLFSKLWLAVMQQMIPPKYITDILGDDCIPQGFAEKDLRKASIIYLAHFQHQLKKKDSAKAQEDKHKD